MAEEAWVRAPQTMLDLLRQRAERHRDKVAFAYSRNGEDEPDQLTYRQLETRARAIASTLQRQGRRGGTCSSAVPVRPGLHRGDLWVLLCRERSPYRCIRRFTAG